MSYVRPVWRCAAAGALAATTVAAALGTPLFGTDDVRISIEGGRVTLSATEAPLAEVLAEWSRVGGTRFVGAETLGGETVNLQLEDADEADAIRLLLRSAAGFVAAPRRPATAGAARYDRVTVLATRRTHPPTPRDAAPAVGNGTDDRGNPAVRAHRRAWCRWKNCKVPHPALPDPAA